MQCFFKKLKLHLFCRTIGTIQSPQLLLQQRRKTFLIMAVLFLNVTWFKARILGYTSKYECENEDIFPIFPSLFQDWKALFRILGWLFKIELKPQFPIKIIKCLLSSLGPLSSPTYVLIFLSKHKLCQQNMFSFNLGENLKII